MVNKRLVDGEESVPITFVCLLPVKEKLIMLANKEKRSMSQEIRFLLEDAVDQRLKELGIQPQSPS